MESLRGEVECGEWGVKLLLLLQVTGATRAQEVVKFYCESKERVTTLSRRDWIEVFDGFFLLRCKKRTFNFYWSNSFTGC